MSGDPSEGERVPEGQAPESTLDGQGHIPVLYETDDYLAANKPEGVVSVPQADAGGLPALLRLLAALDDLPPIVWNTNLYCTSEALEMTAGLAAVYLVDLKFGNAACAASVAGAEDYWSVVRARLGDINAKLQDNLSGIRVIQAFAREDLEYSRFSKESERYYHARVKGIRYWSIFFPAIRFFGAMGAVVVLGVGSVMVVKGQLTIGTLVAFLAYITSIYEPINRLTEVDNIFQEAIAAGERIFELLDETTEVKDAPDAIDLPVIRGEMGFDQVHFRYGSGDQVLHDISFTMAPGEMVALVGPSGAGKTSIANLICRFYDPVKGHVTVDGRDLRNIKLASLRRQVGVVLQDSFLFNNTIAENLYYGKPDASEGELMAAARAANAHDFIMQLPEGYDTEIGERGVKLSGGQKQRLALARAILADPRILILDEATSSVDAEAEYLIQQALERVLKGRTALVIAHRLSTIRNADKIIVLNRGRIAEVGKHRELMQRNGLYSQLYQRQMDLATV